MCHSAWFRIPQYAMAEVSQDHTYQEMQGHSLVKSIREGPVIYRNEVICLEGTPVVDDKDEPQGIGHN